MTYAGDVLRSAARRLLLVQALLVLAVAAAFLFAKGGPGLLAAAFGGGIALVNTSISAWRLGRATEAAANDAGRGMMELYLGAVMRFVATPALVAAGIAVLRMDPVGIIAGFAVAQLGYLFNRVPASPDRHRPGE